jgi:hypothetical protein
LPQAPVRRSVGLLVAGAVTWSIWIAGASHYPVFVDPERSGGAQVVEDLERSWAFYGDLTPGSTDRYRLEAGASDEVSFEVLVPKRDDLRDYRPYLEISGPGFEGDCRLRVGDDCWRVPINAGAASFYEAFTQTYYWSYTKDDPQGSSVRFPQEASYLLTVGVDQGDGGPYALATVGADQFSASELLLFPLEWVRVRLWYFG